MTQNRLKLEHTVHKTRRKDIRAIPNKNGIKAAYLYLEIGGKKSRQDLRAYG